MTDAYTDGSQATMEQGHTSEDADDQVTEKGSDGWWLHRARSAYSSSEDWFDSSVRRKIEDNMDLFNSEHTKGSKYNNPAYSKRSKLFRPKIRSATTKMEASASAAFFATQDAVTCIPPNSADKMQSLGAAINAELLNHRLATSIPWYLTCIGALQDTMKQGVVISKQVWRYNEVDQFETETFYDDEDNVIGEINEKRTAVTQDHPDIVLIPIENIRISPASDWRDPIETSPFVIDMEAFYVHEIEERGGREAGPGQVSWREVSRDEIRSAAREDWDSIRQAREGSRQDRYDDVHTSIEAYDVVWVRHHIMRVDGEDWYYDTLGGEVLLSDPVPYDGLFPTSKRHYRMGFSTIETHKPYPAGKIEINKPLQLETNDITNLRIDAIRHVLSPRYFVKRGQSVDMLSLMRNTPGGVTAMDDPNNDVKIRQISDPTGGSYQEQDRLATEFDELFGTFSGSSVANNRRMNETVGGMELIAGDANQVTEMAIRIFTETWVEPVLQQVMELEQALESDEVVLAIAGQRNGVHPRVAFEMLSLPVTVRINVGYGATDPQKRIGKVAFAFRTLAEIKPELIQEADGNEIVNEIFGAIGFKNAERFFPSMSNQQKKDPEIDRLTKENEQLKGMLQQDAPRWESAKVVAEIREQGALKREQLKLEHAKAQDLSRQQLQHRVEQNKTQVAMLNYYINKEENQLEAQSLVEQRRALNHQIMMDEADLRLRVQTMVQSPPPRPEGVVPSGSKPSATNPQPPSNRDRIAEAPDLPGVDKAGTIARDRYGDIPFATG